MMRFCRECNNLLYPRENREDRRLEYACKLCPFVETNVSGSCVFVNELVKNASTGLGVIPSDLNKDPTLQRSRDVLCASCGYREAVFFQAEVTTKSSVLRLIFICCQCGHKWKFPPEE